MLSFTRHVPAGLFAPLQLRLDRDRQNAAESLIKQNGAQVERLQQALDAATAPSAALDTEIASFLTALRGKTGNPFTSRPAMWLDEHVRRPEGHRRQRTKWQHKLNAHFNSWIGNYELWGDAVLDAVRVHTHARIRLLGDQGFCSYLQRRAPQHVYSVQAISEWPEPMRNVDLVVCTPERHALSTGATVKLLRDAVQSAPVGVFVIDVLRAFPLLAAGALATTVLTPWPWQILSATRYVRFSHTQAEWRLLARLAGAPHVQSGTLGPAFAWVHTFA